MIPYGRQDIDADDISAVVDVLKSDFLTQGPAIPAFETAFAEVCEAKHAVAVTSATAALHIACLALDLGPGDWLWTSPITFVASSNVGIMCGAKVDFVDVDSETACMSADALEEKLIAAKKQGRLPKIVMPVHYAGQSAEMDRIGALAETYGFSIIEDASHAVGARFGNRPVGACAHSQIAVFSFHPVKIITTGEGGMATTNSDALAQKMALLRSHGVTRDPALMEWDSDGPWYYQQVTLGFNYRITDIQAALGTRQLEKLTRYIERRHEIARAYDRDLAGLPLQLPQVYANSHSSLHLYPVRTTDASPIARRELFEALRADGIGVNVHYIPVHLQPYYKRLGFAPGDFPVAEDFYSRAISLPMFPTLSESDQSAVVKALCRHLG